ncbi:MAG: LysM peptidoglycan-binding domain-containing protein [Gemmatimonadota bacterium]|nr:LysM peptidoglycan-binding domain-containing protein [Gemmatimonadota bacterium]
MRMSLRKLNFSRGAVLLVALLCAASATAQQPAETGRTHQVKRGDTLWDLARTYLSDPFLWPEIYRLNTAVVEDPHWIYPGEVLRIPGGPTVVARENEPAVQPSEAVTGERRLGSTIFAKQIVRRGTASQRGQLVIQEARTAVRPGEYYAAPWVDRHNGPVGRGELVGPADLPGISQASQRVRLQNEDRVYVTLPRGVTAARGDRFLLARLGAELGRDAQLVLPTGIVEVERSVADEATTARIVNQFEAVKVGDIVIPLERFAMALDARPAAVTLGPTAKVLWVPEISVLPTVQRYLVLDATLKDGVKMGDQFTLYRPRLRTPEGVTLPDERVALVQVVRVSERGATGIIVDQVQPPIKMGLPARMTARMP